MSASDRVPVTVLTGFLGAGKTTLLNRILSEEHGQRIAVIENEYGELGIDHDLVLNADEEIFEMNNGCICCTYRGDLVRIIGRLLKRRNRFDRILIETTGLADPGPVAQTFFVDEDIAERAVLDSIITVVDAKHVDQHLDRDPEVAKQLAFGDVLILNKSDLVDADALSTLERRVRNMNAVARIVHAEHAKVDIPSLLRVGGFDLDRALNIDPAFLNLVHDHDHDHDHDRHDAAVGSVAFAWPGTFDIDALTSWLGELGQTRGPDLYRTKGIVNVAGEMHRFVFHGIHMLFDGTWGRPWRPDEARDNRLVFIGRDLDRDVLEAGLRGCMV